MQRLWLYGLTGFLFLLVSCGPMTTREDATDINQKGIELINAGKYEEALQAFLQAIKNPRISKESKGTIYRNIAITYNQLHKKDSAIHFSTLAFKCYQKNSSDYLANAAEVDLLKGKTARALAKLQKAASLNPDEMAVNNTLGLIYLGEYDDAFIDLDKALMYNTKAFELNDSRVIEEVLARNYYRLENYEKAELHFEHLVQNYPDMLSYAMDMCMVKYKLNKQEEAEQLFDSIRSKDSTYIESIDIFREHN